MSRGVIRTETVLDRIIAYKWEEIAAALLQRPLLKVEAAAQAAPPPLDFANALRRQQVALIAEVKHASPSKGVLVEDFDPLAIARFYAQHGAAAISVLTDERFFMGHLDYLMQIRAAVDLPLLRKDFTLHPYQIFEARAAGADAILLIAAALEDGLLAELQALSHSLGMATLVEVHNMRELERVLRLPLTLLGINNRNLHDFTVDLGITARLADHVPQDVMLVGESGIRTAADVQTLGMVDAILVGETVITAPDRAATMRELSSVPRQTG